MTAPDALTAAHALDAIHATWTTKPQPSSVEIFDYIKKNVNEGGGRGRRGERVAGGRHGGGDTVVAAELHGGLYRAHAAGAARGGGGMERGGS